eukprot:g15961.t1
MEVDAGAGQQPHHDRQSSSLVNRGENDQEGLTVRPLSEVTKSNRPFSVGEMPNGYRIAAELQQKQREINHKVLEKAEKDFQDGVEEEKRGAEKKKRAWEEIKSIKEQIKMARELDMTILQQPKRQKVDAHAPAAAPTTTAAASAAEDPQVQKIRTQINADTARLDVLKEK